MTNWFPIRRLRQFGSTDERQAPVLTVIALALVALMLMTGLGVDAGTLRYEKQQMHKAADAGASALICGGQIPVAAQNLGDGSLKGSVLLSHQSTSEKHGRT